MPGSYQGLGYFTGFPEPIMFNGQAKAPRRRKSTPGVDHVKHRRTRSGCYTCRSRRVKVFGQHLLPTLSCRVFYRCGLTPVLQVRRNTSSLRKYDPIYNPPLLKTSLQPSPLYKRLTPRGVDRM